MYPKSIQELIKRFSKFPTVGPRTAARFAFYLLSAPKKEISDLVESISTLKDKVKFCSFCFNSFEPSQSDQPKEKGLCSICANPSRDQSKLCVVAKEVDLEALEKTQKYKGLYFVLGGTVSNLKKENIEKLRVKELIRRIKHPQKFGISTKGFKEIILALNPNTPGKSTALYLKRSLKPLEVKVTQLGRGLPTGGELEYADEETLEGALKGRK